MTASDRKLLKVLDGETVFPPPIWIMRQAGRYLPEYRATRAKAKNFLDFCYTPDLAVEVTHQPIRRYGLDAAILFSDILVIPDALGQGVRFVEGEGPRLDAITTAETDTLSIERVIPHLAPVFETVERLRRELPPETTLLGFCGAPWTIATYMIAGRGTPDQGPARRAALSDPDGFARLIDIIVEASALYLVRQFDAGADAVQIFDSWAGVLDDLEFTRWVIEPTVKLVRLVRQARPGARIIGFPRGANGFLERFVAATGVNAVGLDWTVPLDQAARLQSVTAVQGNLDPLRVVHGGRAIDEGVDAIMAALSGGRFIFNLGHGITPDANPDELGRVVSRVRSWSRS